MNRDKVTITYRVRLKNPWTGFVGTWRKDWLTIEGPPSFIAKIRQSKRVANAEAKREVSLQNGKLELRYIELHVLTVE